MTQPTRTELESAACALAALAELTTDEGLARELSAVAFALIPDETDSPWFRIGLREWAAMLRSRFEPRGHPTS